MQVNPEAELLGCQQEPGDDVASRERTDDVERATKRILGHNHRPFCWHHDVSDLVVGKPRDQIPAGAHLVVGGKEHVRVALTGGVEEDAVSDAHGARPGAQHIAGQVWRHDRTRDMAKVLLVLNRLRQGGGVITEKQRVGGWNLQVDRLRPHPTDIDWPGPGQGGVY